MRFLVEFSEGGSATVRGAWLKVLRHLGHQADFWNPQIMSAHDAFARIEPHAYFGTTYGVDDAVEKCIRARPEMRVGLFGSAWGPLVDELPISEFPIVRTGAREAERLEKLKRETGQPSFVFIHASGEYLEGSMSGWRSIGIESIGVLNAADVYAYRPGQFQPNLACDAGFVGGRWNYKSKKLDPYILPLTKILNVKIFGRNPWPTPSYLGTISQRGEVDLFKSATICLNVSEPHSSSDLFGCDIIERVFKVMACGGFLLTDHVPEMSTVFPAGCYEDAKNPDEFLAKALFYANNPQQRLPYMQAGKSAVLAKHTYHHRVEQLLRGLGYYDEADKCLPLLKQILGD